MSLGTNLSLGPVSGSTRISSQALTGRQFLFPFGEATEPRIVFRVIRPDENPLTGLLARNPTSTASPSFAVSRGSTFPTQFIPTTADLNVALGEARLSGNAVVAIDLTKLPAGARVIDLSSGAARDAAGLLHPIARNFARASAEILIEIEVPAEAILDYVPIGVGRP